MKTIEERAIEKYPIKTDVSLTIDYGKDSNFMYREGYTVGAIEQDPISRADEREKVIEKACEWLSHCVGIMPSFVEEFEQAMEE